MAFLIWMAGMVPQMLSTWFMIFWVRSMDVAGGMSTTPMIVPVSSLGTREVAVVLMSHTSTPTEAATVAKLMSLWLMNQSVAFLYHASSRSNTRLNASMKLRWNMPATPRRATAQAITPSRTLLKLNHPSTRNTIAASSSSDVTIGGICSRTRFL